MVVFLFSLLRWRNHFQVDVSFLSLLSLKALNLYFLLWGSGDYLKSCRDSGTVCVNDSQRFLLWKAILMSFRGKHRLYLFVQNPGIFSNPFWSDESKVSFYLFHFIFHFFFAPLHFSFPILWILGRVTNQKLESIILLLPFYFAFHYFL